jgi:hypothetical protein
MKQLQVIGVFIFSFIYLSQSYAQDATRADSTRLQTGCISGTCKDGTGVFLQLVDNHTLPVGAAVQYVKMAGIFDKYGLFSKGIVTLHGFKTAADGDYEGADNYFGICLSGHCKNGKGIKIEYGGLKVGRFSNDEQVSGTVEIFNPSMPGGEGIFTITDPKRENIYKIMDGRFKPYGVDYDFIVDILKRFNEFFKLSIYYKNPMTPAAATWYKNIYTPYLAAVEAKKKAEEENRMAEYRADQELKITNPSLYYLRHPKEQPGYYPDSYYKPSSSSSGSSGSTSSSSGSFHTCSVCNGHGYTEYDCGQGGGHPCRKYCSACNGSGQVHN